MSKITINKQQFIDTPKITCGYGFVITKDGFEVLDFIGSHHDSFLKSKPYNLLDIVDGLNRMRYTGELHCGMQGTLTVANGNINVNLNNWECMLLNTAVRNIISYETGIELISYRTKDSGGIILFPNRFVWEYNQTELNLTQEKLLSILSKYAEELESDKPGWIEIE